ncbi:hypothetical protein BDW74DRAFT_153779 [Aspergillus multicolor]|uniref:uncharacterized protein n=1 Tax=Aspergillus multicolor TaxID=41759 RepID=UPI003CCE5059
MLAEFTGSHFYHYQIFGAVGIILQMKLVLERPSNPCLLLRFKLIGMASDRYCPMKIPLFTRTRS